MVSATDAAVGLRKEGHVQSTKKEMKKRSKLQRVLTQLAVLLLFLVTRQLVPNLFRFMEEQLIAVNSLFQFENEVASLLQTRPFVVDRSKQEPLNILVLYPDDWRYNAIGDLQPGFVFTPFLSQLARQGIRFTNNFATTSICWISRATLFTGQYASKHGSNRLRCPRFMAARHWNGTWPYLLQKFGGYFVGHVGKWQFYGSAKPLFNWSSFHEGRHWYKMGKDMVHAADRAADDAIRFLRERPKTSKFALTVAYYPPKPIGDSDQPGAQWEPHPRHLAPYQNHTFIPPYNFTEAFELLPSFLKRGVAAHRFGTRFRTNEMYQASLRNYMALVSHVDEASSRIIEELKIQGMLNRTMIIVTADNGMMLGSHGLAGKWHPFEDSIRVPLVIYDPRLPESKAGIVEDSITLNIDVAATIVGAAKIPRDDRMQGQDIADLYLGRSSYKVVPTMTPDTTNNNTSVMTTTTTTGMDPNGGEWRKDFFYEFPLAEFPSSTALRTHRYKYLQWSGKGGILEQLFDLEKDPLELHDLVPLLQNNNDNHNDLLALLVQLRTRHNVLRDFYIADDPLQPMNTSCF